MDCVSNSDDYGLMINLKHCLDSIDENVIDNMNWKLSDQTKFNLKEKILWDVN